MNRSPQIAWAKQAGLGFVLVFFSSLLTVLFSFLGTITCSALVGMMCGSTRQWKWQVIPVSLVFPVVATVFLMVSNTHLGLRQQGMIPLLCFAAFWALYGMTFCLVGLEKRNQPEPATQERSVLPEARRPESPCTSGDPLPVSLEGGLDPSLVELQGQWACENGSATEGICTKVIEIAQNQLVLKTLDAKGHWRQVGRGAVELIRLGSFNVLNVRDADPRSSLASHYSWTWIYRVQGDTLALATHFENTAPARPTSEIYVKQAR